MTERSKFRPSPRPSWRARKKEGVLQQRLRLDRGIKLVHVRYQMKDHHNTVAGQKEPKTTLLTGVQYILSPTNKSIKSPSKENKIPPSFPSRTVRGEQPNPPRSCATVIRAKKGTTKSRLDSDTELTWLDPVGECRDTRTPYCHRFSRRQPFR